jgi:hypothetical protein
MTLMYKMPIAFAFAMALWCGPCAQAIKRTSVAFDFAFVDAVLEQEAWLGTRRFPMDHRLLGLGGL